MSSQLEESRCSRVDDVPLYALRALSPGEAQLMELHIASCNCCREELTALSPVVESFSAWRTDVLRPSVSLWDQLVNRIAVRNTADHELSRPPSWIDVEWEDVAPGIACKLLSSDSQRDRVSMLVRLAPGTEYPPHRHAGTEELHLLAGELWIDERKLLPGDYNRAERGTADKRVWTETGCTCLLITSPSDMLG